MIDPDCQRLLQILSIGGTKSSGGDIAAKRDGFRKLLQLFGLPGPASVLTRDTGIATPAGRIPLRLYRTQPGDAGVPTIVFFHGGGFVAGDIDTHDGICRLLAEASQCQIVSVDYRLAPEHVFPAQIEDGIAALRAIVAAPAAFGADPARLAVGGDSVGAGLATMVARHWRGAAGPRLKLQLLICPALEATGRFPSRKQFATGYYIEDSMIADDFEAYRGPGRTHIDSILDGADLHEMPPAIIHVAGCDPFRDEGIAYGDALARAGVATQVVCHDGMIHLFHAFAKIIPAGREALRAIGANAGVTLRADC